MNDQELKIKNLEFRERKFYINSAEKSNYIYNSSIKLMILKLH